MKDNWINFRVSREDVLLFLRAGEKAKRELGTPLSRSALILWLLKKYLERS